MYKVLQISRSTYYYEEKIKPPDDELSSKISKIFHPNLQSYSTRKIKVELKQLGLTVSRRRIGRIMKENKLVSTYTVAQFKPHKDNCNESMVANELNQAFKQEDLAVVVSDLTYVRVNQKWHYICLFHTDRGNEFKNKIIDETLKTFQIKRSLNMKGGSIR